MRYRCMLVHHSCALAGGQAGCFTVMGCAVHMCTASRSGDSRNTYVIPPNESHMEVPNRKRCRMGRSCLICNRTLC